MARGLVIGRRKVRLRFVFFLATIIFSILWLASINTRQKDYATVEYGSVTTWNSGDGLIIRDEEIFNADGYGKIEYFTADGEAVEKDDLVAVLYKNNYNEALIDSLYEVKQKISDYQKKNVVQDILDSDYEKIESNINEIVQNIQVSIHDKPFSTIEYQEKQLRNLLARRQELLNKKITPDQYLEKLYTQESKLSQQIDEWKTEIVAPDSGIICFQTDGFEQILNIGSLDYMTVEEFSTILETISMQDSQTGEKTGQPLFKLIDPAKWYLACRIPTANIFYEKNDVISVKLLGSNEKILEGVVYKIDRGTDSTLIIIEFTEGIDSIINIRDLPVEIGKTTEGLLVPSASIVKSNGKTGVESLYKGQVRFIEVKIKTMDEQKAAIEKVGDVDGLNVHDKVLVH